MLFSDQIALVFYCPYMSEDAFSLDAAHLFKVTVPFVYTFMGPLYKQVNPKAVHCNIKFESCFYIPE